MSRAALSDPLLQTGRNVCSQCLVQRPAVRKGVPVRHSSYGRPGLSAILICWDPSYPPDRRLL